MRSGVNGFQGQRLYQGRLSRGLTQTALASIVGKSSGTVSKWENGEQSPEADALESLSKSLGIPAPWFLKPVPNYGDAVCFFRSNASVTREAQNIALVRLKWLNEISLALQKWIDWPEVAIPHFDYGDSRNISDVDIENCASECRRAWSLGVGPIADVLLVLENAGVICVREELGLAKMDGASKWFASDERPYVFLSADKANGVRSRFDAAHELGHLVLHRRVSDAEFGKRHTEIERQAHLFASAFLLPAESFAAEVGTPSLDTFLTLKRRWKVSVGAMIMRCRSLDIIDDGYATRLWKNYSARGWRRGEPRDEEIPFEAVRLLPRAVNLLLNEGGLTKEGICLSLGLSPTDLESLCSLPSCFLSTAPTISTFSNVKMKARAVDQHAKAEVIQFPSRK